jgi:predicted AAA+ superfamily ATPase
MLTGPRASGKTTTALRHTVDAVRLDRPREAAAYRADPDVALAGHETPLLVDEWQLVPEVLGAIKRAVDSDATPGRFVVTGSVRSDLDDQTWPGTGRYLTDTGLTAAALRVDARDILRDGVLLGRFLDAYVTMQIRSEVTASDAMPRLHHVRDRDGPEIDLLLDYGRRGLIAIEIKATAAPTRADAVHLIWFREQLPGVRAGLVLHTGPRAYLPVSGLSWKESVGLSPRRTLAMGHYPTVN